MTSQQVDSDQTARVVGAAYTALARQRRLRTALLLGLLVVGAGGAGVVSEVDLAALDDVVAGLRGYVYDSAPEIHRATLADDLQRWYWNLDTWALQLWKTVLIAFVATTIGAASALAFAFLAARNVMRCRVVSFIARRTLELCRTVPEVVFALIFVFAFHPGPPAGVLAIAVHTFGVLGKLFAEVTENIKPAPVLAVRACGANELEVVRLGVLPQVLANFTSYTLLRFEINVRAATVIGIVGAGGIGQELLVAITQFRRTDVSAIVLMIVIVVMLIDELSRRARLRFIEAAT